MGSNDAFFDAVSGSGQFLFRDPISGFQFSTQQPKLVTNPAFEPFFESSGVNYRDPSSGFQFSTQQPDLVTNPAFTPFNPSVPATNIYGGNPLSGNLGPEGNLPNLPNPGFRSDLFSSFRDENLNIPFAGAVGRANLTPNELRNIPGQRANILNLFLARLDDQLKQGLAPTQRGSEFLDQFDFSNYFRQRNPSAFETRFFNPSTRVIRS
mgnify:CR=1 FL=1